ncbi:MAG TPA: DUF4215 domain-containing protein [Polyangiales bacterium]
MRSLAYWVFSTCLFALAACSNEVAVPTKTQVTLRVQLGDDALLSKMTDLRVSVSRKDDAWVPASSVTLPKVRLMRWPVDIPITPSSSIALARPFEVVIDVLADGGRLAQARVISAYAPDALRVLEVWVYSCADGANGACAADDCRGESCSSCAASKRCESVSIVDPATLPAYAPQADPSLTPPNSPQPDAGTDGSTDPEQLACDAEGTRRCVTEGTRQRERCVMGRWQADEACPEGQVCDAKSLATGGCAAPLDLCRGSANAAVCAGAMLHVCGPNGTALESMMCNSARHCELGTAAKSCAPCVPGEHRCNMRLLERCDTNLQWQAVMECPATGNVCNAAAGACTDRFCKAGTFSCSADGLTLQRCNADETAFEAAGSCTPGGCDAIGGQCDVCTPKAVDCEGNSARTCNADGQGHSVTPCEAPRAICAGAGKCVECANDTHCKAAECMSGTCNVAMGSCTATPSAKGTPCSTGLCDGAGKCGYCGDRAVQSGEACDDGNEVATDACNACKNAGCGDGVVQAGEDCDDGNTTNTDSCANCKNARCGDGFLQPGEQCDDGNTIDTDGCTACKSPSCGDGHRQASEQCDDGNTLNTDACVDCQNARCGDGHRQTGVEQCDDGNSINTDSCAGCKTARCGDGFRQSGEDCDDGNTVDTDACTNACKGARCGDGFQQSGEQCDDGNTSNTDTCTNTCKDARCGDGFTQSGEQCDDGNTSSSDACVACKTARCGDGVIRTGVEECELNTGGWSTISCRAETCTRIYFNQCTVNTNCASGEHCGVTGGTCTSWCTGDGDCASVPGFNAGCVVGGGGFCAIRCGLLGSCPAGLRCASSYGWCVKDTSCCNAEFGCDPCFWPSGA